MMKEKSKSIHIFNYKWLYILIGLFCYFLLTSQVHSYQNRPQNIILIGWDGTQRQHLKEMISRKELPNLTALVEEGVLVDIDITTGATDTKAGWTQILTGYSPDISGVLSNGRYRPIPVGYSVFERLEKYFGHQNIVTAAMIGKKGHVDAGGA